METMLLEWKVLLATAVAGMVASLIAGKTLKRVVAWIIRRLTEKTETQLDDKLVDSIEEDWNIDRK